MAQFNCYIALVDKDARTLTVEAYSTGQRPAGWPFSRPRSVTPTVVHSEPLPGGVTDTADWSARLDAAGFKRDGFAWGTRGEGWQMILAEQQPAVA